MKKYNRFNLLILSPSGSNHRQVSFSKWVVGSATFFAIVGVALLGYVLTDYLQLKKVAWDNQRLAQKIATQNEIIKSKQEQIELFANKLDVLKSHFVGLKKLEKKVKVLANIQDESDRNNVFSIGGSDSDDNDPVSIDPLSQDVQNRLHDSLARKVNNDTETLFLASINQKESLEELLHSLKDRAGFIARTPSIRPASGWISSSFGYRAGPFSNVKEFHRGLDIAGREGSEILASADGVVKFIGRNGAFGNMVTIDHGSGMVTKYAHLRKILVNRGESVKRGDAIGFMGNTGRSTGPHLHYEVVLNGINVNPLTYIQN